jgi:hypothetical protein
VTVASLLPTSPLCRMPDQQMVAAKVVGVNPDFDLEPIPIGPIVEK